MARGRRLTEDEVRQALLEMARQLFGRGRSEVSLFAVRGEVLSIIPEPPAPAGPVPEGMSAYDAAILQALTGTPMSSQRLAHRAGHRHNSYFRSRLAALVEAGHVRHTRKGYRQHVG